MIRRTDPVIPRVRPIWQEALLTSNVRAVHRASHTAATGRWMILLVTSSAISKE